MLREEFQTDMDTFDYIYYYYGMKHYGNMPLIEPLETRETRKIEDFVIVVDTSMSCKGDLIRKFLEETYSVLGRIRKFLSPDPCAYSSMRRQGPGRCSDKGIKKR